MLALSLLALAGYASALCADPVEVEAMSQRLAPIIADSRENCTATCTAARAALAYYRPGSCYCGSMNAIVQGEAVLAPDCGMAYAVSYTFVPAGKVPKGKVAPPRPPLITCGPGELACNTRNKVGWECLPVNATSDSCGGCVNGQYGLPESTSGEDCTFLPGVAEGGATCVKGKCRVKSCIEGWSLRANPRDKLDTACVYHIYENGVLRGTEDDEQWVAQHLEAWGNKIVLQEVMVETWLAKVPAPTGVARMPMPPAPTSGAALPADPTGGVSVTVTGPADGDEVVGFGAGVKVGVEVRI